MGWRYQHDIKVKKVWKAVAITAAVLSFYGCAKDPTNGALDNYETTTGTTSQVINVWNKGKVFLVDYNFDNPVPKRNMASIEKVKTRIAGEKQINSNLVQNQNDKFDTILKEKNAILEESLRKSMAAREASDYTCEVQEVVANIGDKKEFVSYYDMALSKPEAKEAECKYIGKNCIVWNIPVEVNGEYPQSFQVPEDAFERIGKKFDYIYDLETSFNGSPRYTKKCDPGLIDSHDKIEIILTDICGDAENTGATYSGYFSQNDVLKKNYKFSDGSTNSFSNETQCIFVDSITAIKQELYAYTVLIHEFQHLINFCYKQQFGSIASSWFTEMLSMLTEDVFTKYMNTPLHLSPASRLVLYEMNYGYCQSPFVWYSLGDVELIGYSYAATYAYGSYLARNYGGLDFIHQLAISPYVDYYAVEDTFIKMGYTYDKEFEDLNNMNHTFIDFPRILINIEPNEGEDISTINKNGYPQYHTLNRGWTSSSYPELTLEPINLIQTYTYTGTDGNEYTVDIYPIYLEPQFEYNDYYVFYCATAIWYVGENIQKFRIFTPDVYGGYYKVMYPGHY